MHARRTLMPVGALLATALVLALAGCGEESSPGTGGTVADAQQFEGVTFPQTDGKKTLTEILGDSKPNAEVSLALGAQDFVQGEANRFPFGLFTTERKPVWAPTAVYIAKDANSPAEGPFKARGISLDVPEEFRSNSSRADYGKAGNGIYVAELEALPDAAKQEVVTLSEVDGEMLATKQTLTFNEESATPKVGAKAPVIDNQTIDDVGEENIDQIETRDPPDNMHSVRMQDAIDDEEPVVLVYSTPQHCVSRVCGPVTDIAEYMNSKYGGAAQFIHQEIYNDNDPAKGFVEQIGPYRLPTEPYTFVIDAQGRIAFKFEGPITVPELESAVREVTGRNEPRVTPPQRQKDN